MGFEWMNSWIVDWEI